MGFTIYSGKITDGNLCRLIFITNMIWLTLFSINQSQQVSKMQARQTQLL